MKCVNQFLFFCFATVIMYFSISCKNDSDNDLPLINVDSKPVFLLIVLMIGVFLPYIYLLIPNITKK